MNENVLDVIKFAINVLQLLGIAVAIIVLAVLGIKFFIGNSQEKAKLKGRTGTYILGMFLLLGGPVIVNIIVEGMIMLTGDPGKVYVMSNSQSKIPEYQQDDNPDLFDEKNVTINFLDSEYND